MNKPRGTATGTRTTTASRVSQKDKFIEALRIESGYVGRDSVESVYYGLIRMMSRELRVTGTFKLLEWGTFNLLKIGAKRMLNVSTQQFFVAPSKRVLKYKPEKQLKEYFKHMV